MRIIYPDDNAQEGLRVREGLVSRFRNSQDLYIGF